MDFREIYLPHAGWLRHAAADEVAQFLARGWFEYREQAFLWLYLRPGSIFLDIGAHVGLFSIIAARATGGQGPIVCVEPHSESATLLEQNLIEHQVRSAHVHRNALASMSGSAILHLAPEGKAAYSSLYPAQEFSGDAVVEALTLDGLLAREGIATVDLAKIDVEGAEIEVLRGASESLRRGCLPALLIECTEANLQRAASTTRELFDMLTGFGYAVCRFDSASRQLVPREFQRPIDYENLFAAQNLREVNERLASASNSAVRISRDIISRGEACEAAYHVELRASKAFESAERSRLALEEAYRALGDAAWRAEQAEKRGADAEKRAADARAEALESERRADESRHRAEKAAREIDQAYRNGGEANWRAEEAEKRAEASEIRANQFYAQVQESERRAEESRKRAEEAAREIDQAYRNGGEANWRAEEAERRAEAAERRAAGARAQMRVSERRVDKASIPTHVDSDAAPSSLPSSPPETEMMRALRHLQEKGFRPRTVLDIGAGKGYWSIVSWAHFPDAAHYLIEPIAEHEPDLQELCRKNPLCRFRITAVGDKVCPRTLTVGHHFDESTMLGFPGADIGRQRTIPATTVDVLLEEGWLSGPDLVKIDVQGMEMEVLRGASKLFGAAEVFIIEVNLFKFMPDCPRVHEIIQFMAERDFYLFDVAGMLRRPYQDDLGQLDLVMVSGRSAMLSSNRWE